jgi:hypothetical protein
MVLTVRIVSLVHSENAQSNPLMGRNADSRYDEIPKNLPRPPRIAKVLIPTCDRWNEMGIEKWKSQDGKGKKREEKFY